MSRCHKNTYKNLLWLCYARVVAGAAATGRVRVCAKLVVTDADVGPEGMAVSVKCNE